MAIYEGRRASTTCVRRALAGLKASCGLLARDEQGGAYTLSYVMVVPIVMLLMCLIIETTLMMTAKLGTVYAAYAGARAGSVWATATSWEQAEDRIERAAVQAFVPFASGSSRPGESQESSGASRYVDSYQAFVDDPVSESYVTKKYQNAVASLSVTTDGPPARWDSELTVTVEYEFPFRVPGIGRLLGQPDGNGGYQFVLSSQAALQNEGPQNDRQELGIGYGRLE